MQKLGWCYCGSMFTIFLVGLPMWLLGCNPNVANGCLTQTIYDGNLTQVTVKSGVCCVVCTINSNSSCCPNELTCYSYVLHVQTTMGNYEISNSDIFKNATLALNAGNVYPKHLFLTIDNSNHSIEIYNNEPLWTIWWIGVILLAITTFMCGCPILGISLWMYWKCCSDAFCKNHAENQKYHNQEGAKEEHSSGSGNLVINIYQKKGSGLISKILSSDKLNQNDNHLEATRASDLSSISFLNPSSTKRNTISNCSNCSNSSSSSSSSSSCSSSSCSSSSCSSSDGRRNSKSHDGSRRNSDSHGHSPHHYSRRPTPIETSHHYLPPPPARWLLPPPALEKPEEKQEKTIEQSTTQQSTTQQSVATTQQQTAVTQPPTQLPLPLPLDSLHPFGVQALSQPSGPSLELSAVNPYYALGNMKEEKDLVNVIKNKDEEEKILPLSSEKDNQEREIRTPLSVTTRNVKRLLSKENDDDEEKRPLSTQNNLEEEGEWKKNNNQVTSQRATPPTNIKGQTEDEEERVNVTLHRSRSNQEIVTKPNSQEDATTVPFLGN